MEDHLVTNDEAIEIPTEKDDCVERFGKDGRYHKRKWRPESGGRIIFFPNTVKNGLIWHCRMII